MSSRNNAVVIFWTKIARAKSKNSSDTEIKTKENVILFAAENLRLAKCFVALLTKARSGMAKM